MKSKAKFKVQPRRIATLFFTLFLLTAFSSKNIICIPQKKEFSSLKNDVFSIEKELFELINKEREKFGLSSLESSPDLSLLARKHSQDMASHEKISHLSSSGKSYTDRLIEGGFFFKKNGENVAFSETFLPDIIHQAFMKSSGHREHILDPDFNQLGIGVAFKETKGYYITQDYIQSLVLQENEAVKKAVQKNVNNLRNKKSLPPLLFLKEADEYAYTYSFSKVVNKSPPPFPSHFGETQLVHIVSPSLKESYPVYKDEILNEIYETAGLGIIFSRHREYPGGSYFITLLLFPENKYKYWSNKDLKEIIFHTVNNFRKKKKLYPLVWDEKLTFHAEKMIKKILTQNTHAQILLPRSQRATVFSFITVDPTLFPNPIKEKIETNLRDFTRIGIGILFGKNNEYPRGAFWVSIFFEE